MLDSQQPEYWNHELFWRRIIMINHKSNHVGTIPYSGIERRHNASLGDRNSLLFHNFVNSNSIGFCHFVKFIDATNSTISKNKSATFKNEFFCDWILKQFYIIFWDKVFVIKNKFTFWTQAVRPTPDDPRPVVYWHLGANLSMNPNNCDLATPGSPIKQMFRFPLMFIPESEK